MTNRLQHLRSAQAGLTEISTHNHPEYACFGTSLDWSPRQAPGSGHARSEVDWYRAVPSTLSYGPKNIGLGLEVQFGNNFQFNEDLKSLSEAILEQTIVAGICVVPSDEFARYKADRGASFSDSKSKMDRFLAILVGVGAAIMPGFVLIGIHPDGFTNVEDGKFDLKAPKFDVQRGWQEGPIDSEDFGTIN